MAQPLVPKLDGRGATIYTGTNYSGRAFAIPSNDYCADLRNVYADFNRQTRSIITEKGYRCEFYLERGCPSQRKYLWIGSPEKNIALSPLRWDYDRRIQSIFCAPVTTLTAADIGPDGYKYMQPAPLYKPLPVKERSPANDNTAALLYAETNQRGNAFAAPGDGACYDTNVRSFTVNSAFQCRFFAQIGCRGEVLPISEQRVDVLPEAVDGNLLSVACVPVLLV
ncbi:hypothetical protein J1614_006546 [Plenodomus biglobosus]|nr:hypothetical protein J1614_006546 [Plenodomus biglobosus]